MRKQRPVNRHEAHEDLIQRLAGDDYKDPDTGKNIFNRLADALIFAAYLGFQLNRKQEFPSNKKKDIGWHIIEAQNDDVFVELINIAECGSTDVLEDNSEIDKVRLFEEYAHAGFSKIINWELDYAGDLLSVIFQGLTHEGFINSDVTKVINPNFDA